MICDWFLLHMPWLVEHIGNAPLVAQLATAFGLLTAILLMYRGLQMVLAGGSERRFNWLSRWRAGGIEREQYQDWMDYERWREDE